MEKNIAIQVTEVSKTFKLPYEKHSSIKSTLVNIFGRKKGYKQQSALEDISFEIKKGEFFGIVGRNGSGKSTLLKIIAGIYPPTKGQVVVNGRLVPFIELGVGFNPELTGKENVYLNGALLGFSNKEIDRMYKEIVEFAELERFMAQKLKNYSTGMQVRLAFSMAIRAKADILLIDEVLAVGDADFQRKCFNYFDQLKNNSTTVILVSHDMDAIREYCDRALLIENSRVVEIGSTNRISQKYLQLFMEQEQTRKEDSKDRWGDRKVYIETVKVAVKETEVIISERIKATEDIESPIVGFRIRDATGKDLTGTNTLIEDTKTPSLKKGRTITIEWRIANIFKDGEYSIDPALLHRDGITVADWWNTAVYFKVSKNRHLPYPIDPGFKIKINKND